MPLPGTVVIPPNWSAHHRPVATGTMTVTVSLRRPGVTSPTFNATTGAKGGTPHTPYLTGAKARLQALSVAEQGAERQTGEQQVTVMPYLLAVDWATAEAVEPLVDDIATVTAVDDNTAASLVGKTFTVKASVQGSLLWERDLTVIQNLG